MQQFAEIGACTVTTYVMSWRQQELAFGKSKCWREASAEYFDWCSPHRSWHLANCWHCSKHSTTLCMYVEPHSSRPSMSCTARSGCGRMLNAPLLSSHRTTYSARCWYLKNCFVCGHKSSLAITAAMLERYQTVHPVCSACLGKGRVERTRGEKGKKRIKAWWLIQNTEMEENLWNKHVSHLTPPRVNSGKQDNS